LADALWPLLDRRILRAIERENQGPPVMRGVLRAHELAMYSRRSNVMPWRYPISR
jgi:hypothetical protein